MDTKYLNTIVKNRNGAKLIFDTQSVKTSQLMKLFEEELKCIFWAEKALTKAIPLMVKHATSMELIEALSSHLEETDEQVERLAQVFAYIDKRPVANKCATMESLIKESQETMESYEAGSIRDAGIILASKKIEHYEIATYMTLLQFAQTLGLIDVTELLTATLNEEKAANKKLLQVAAQAINIQTMEAELENY